MEVDVLLEMLPQTLGPRLFLFTIFTVSLVFYWKSLGNRKKHEPPSPWKFPIIGNLFQLGIYPHRALRDLSAKYGPLMLVHLGIFPVIVASTADVARDIMKTNDVAFSGRPPTMSAEKLMYKSKDVAFAPYGSYWRQMRKVCVIHLLSARQVLSGRPVREEEVGEMINKIASLGSTPIDLSKMVIKLTNDVTCRIALGNKYSDQLNAGGPRETLEEFVALLGAFNIADFIPFLSWVNKLNGLDARAAKCSRDLDNVLEKVIQDHVLSAGRKTNDQHRSFVDILLSLDGSTSTTDTGDQFSVNREAIKAIILDVFAAGTHTSFTVIDWAMTELMRHPEVMRKAQEEVRRIGAEKGMICETDIQHLEYLKMVIKETFRSHPPIPLLIPRESTQDAELQGYRIPKRTRVIVNAWAISMDPDVWERPEEFWPERFLGFPEVDYKGADFQLIPFGAGRRICPGMTFSGQIIELALANLLNRFDWELPEGTKVEDLDMSEASGLTSSRKASLVLVARSNS